MGMNYTLYAGPLLICRNPKLPEKEIPHIAEMFEKCEPFFELRGELPSKTEDGQDYLALGPNLRIPQIKRKLWTSDEPFDFPMIFDSNSGVLGNPDGKAEMAFFVEQFAPYIEILKQYYDVEVCWGFVPGFS